MIGRVVVTRGGFVESVHRVHAVAVDPAGAVVARVGDPEAFAFLRSAAKPLQALPLVEDGVADAIGLTGEELALCCASHNAEHRHVELARSILAKAGCGEADLECGPHLPIRESTAVEVLRGGTELMPIHNNCSGKHGGMLALARAHGWPTAGYGAHEHPVQKRMRDEICRWTGIGPDALTLAVDGCGVTTYGMAISDLAGAFVRFAGGGAGPGRVIEAMTEYPFMVAGTDRLCTALMAVEGDRLFCKTGAEGVYAAGLRDGSMGFAIKVEDGARRASEAVLVDFLDALGCLTPKGREALAGYRAPPVRNTLGEAVGEVRVEMEVERR
jgi:L-asparaginase II